jgi:hypothetical protein
MGALLILYLGGTLTFYIITSSLHNFCADPLPWWNTYPLWMILLTEIVYRGIIHTNTKTLVAVEKKKRTIDSN